MQKAGKHGRGGKREGAGRPALGKVSVHLKLSPQLDEAADIHARQEGTSKSALIEKALAAYLAQSKQP